MFGQKNKKEYRINYKKGGVLLLLVVFFMVLSLIIIFGAVQPTLRNLRTVSDLWRSKQSLFLADSGVADVYYRLRANFTVDNEEILQLDGMFATTTLVDTISGKIVSGLSDYLDYGRRVGAELLKGTGMSFFYGVQAGNGGFFMSGNAQVNGNIYSNGLVSGGTVAGSAISAGPSGLIDGVNVGEEFDGMAYANEVNDSTVAGELRCQIGSGNNKNCDTSYDDPPLLPMPVTDEQIAEWKAEAEEVQVITGNYSPNNPISLGPVKITGDFDVRTTINMTGTIWVQGKLSFGSQGQIRLDNSVYGEESGVIIIDKYTNFSGGGQIMSTGVPGSFVMLLVTSDCPDSAFCSGNEAITAQGHAGSVVLVAPHGTIDFTGNSSAKEVIAYKIVLGGNVAIDYELGLADMNFISGPSGSYHLVSFQEKE